MMNKKAQSIGAGLLQNKLAVAILVLIVLVIALIFIATKVWPAISGAKIFP